MKQEQLSFIRIQNETAPSNPQRLFERFTAERGFDNFDDLDILRTIVALSGNRSNGNEIADKLFDHFGCLKNILEAPQQAISAACGSERTARMISAIVPLTRVWERSAMAQPERIGNSRDAERYCKSLLMGRQNEHFYVICLNAQCQLLGHRLISEGSLSEVSAYPRTVIQTALNFNAHSILLCHNHPGGTSSPSAEDISSTVQLQRHLNALGIMVLDHIIVANCTTYSMIQHGDIDYRFPRNK